MTSPPDGVRSVAAVLAGAAGAALPDDAVDIAIEQHVAPLFAAANPLLAEPARARLLDHVRASTIHDAALDGELRRLLSVLRAAGVRPLVIKGAHLAHSVYPAPHLRPRGDTDLFIAPADRDACARAIASAGYAPAPLTSGSLILGQFAYRRALGPALIHVVDVHWRAAAPLVFEESFDAAAMGSLGVAIPALGPDARGPAPADALALACVHVVSHHWPEASLRWLYDLALLAAALDDRARAAFATAAARGRYRGVAICALDRARALFPSAPLDAVIEGLRATGGDAEPSAALTAPGRTPFGDFLLDLKVAGWRDGPTLVREHLFPPPAYMRLAFGERPLPIAYAARFVRAIRKRLFP